MLAVSAIMTSRRKSGYCEMILCSTDAGKIFLLLGETSELKNRYMIINPPEDWKMPKSEQAENKHRTSTEQVTEQVRALVLSIGKDQLTLKQMMEKMNLKHRPNFIDNYLNPAIADGYIRLLYPQSPHHPRQKYLLTVKGLALYNE